MALGRIRPIDYQDTPEHIQIQLDLREIVSNKAFWIKYANLWLIIWGIEVLVGNHCSSYELTTSVFLHLSRNGNGYFIARLAQFLDAIDVV